MRRDVADYLLPIGPLQLQDLGEVLCARDALGQIEGGVYISLGDVDELSVERNNTLAGSIEAPLKRRYRRIESVLRAVIDFARLSYSLLIHGPHGFGHRTVVVHHFPIIFSALLGGSLSIEGSIHRRASWGHIASDVAGWQPPNTLP